MYVENQNKKGLFFAYSVKDPENVLDSYGIICFNKCQGEKFMETERRQDSRASYETEVSIKSVDSAIESEGKSKNISLSGMFVATEKSFPIDTVCDIEIHVKEIKTKFSIMSQRGKVIRKDKDGIGIAFENVDGYHKDEENLESALKDLSEDISEIYIEEMD